MRSASGEKHRENFPNKKLIRSWTSDFESSLNAVSGRVADQTQYISFEILPTITNNLRKLLKNWWEFFEASQKTERRMLRIQTSLGTSTEFITWPVVCSHWIGITGGSEDWWIHNAVADAARPTAPTLPNTIPHHLAFCLSSSSSGFIGDVCAAASVF